MEVNQLILARSLVDTSSNIIPLRVLNPTDYPCTFYKDTVAAMWEPVDLVEAPRIWQNNVACYQGRGKDGSLTDAVDNDGETPSVPEHLSDLFQRSSHLLNLAKRSQLAQLLIDFADVFAVSSGDLSLVIPAWSPTRLTLDLHILSVSQRDAFHYIDALKPTHCSRTRLKRE